ncbi:MAG TPA: ABC transporter substrate-binding protein [Actinomycetota bacterium]|nr:ABC transporter substrate-binding protein [Actinomycetota bacterium]
MRGRRILAAAVVMGVLSALPLGSVASAQESPSPATTGEPVTLDVGVDTDVTSLNPFRICCGIDYEIMGLMYDLSWNYNNDTLEPAPGIITEWEPSEDYMDWTLTIRDDATFSDGTPLTAEDVAWTFSFIVDNQMPTLSLYFPFKPTFEVTSPTEVIWHSSQPTAAPDRNASLYILPKHIWEPVTAEDPYSAARQYANSEPIGSGPFTMVERSRDEFIHMQARDDWWGGQPNSVTDIVYHIYDNQQTMVTALRNGELDFVDGLNDTLWTSLEGQPNIATHKGDGGCWGNIAWNFGGQDEWPGGPAPGTPTNDPVIHEKDFRVAVAHSINRQELVDSVYGGTADVGYAMLMPGTNPSWQTEIPEDIRYDYDPEMANQILDDAGIVDSNGDGNREYQGNELNIEIMAITNVTGSAETGQFLQGYLADIGVASFLTNVNQSRAYDLWYTGEWDVYVWDWCPSPDPNEVLSYFTTDQCLGWSDGCWSNTQYDDFWELQGSQFDKAERKATVDQMQLLFAEEVPTMVLNYWSDLQAYRTDTFEGYVPSPNNEQGLLLFGWTDTSYMELEVVGTGEAAGSSTGLSAWVWIAIAVVVALVVVGIVLSRRRSNAEEA